MTLTLTLAAWVSVLAPFAGAALVPLAARVGPRARLGAALGGSGLAAAAALVLLPALGDPAALPVEHAVAWLDAPVRVELGLLIDPLSIVLANVVAVISFVILIYCVGYMHGDPGATRFWIWMNGFIGSMLLLVLASNLLWLFVGWKLVGVCSYGLIGYYYADRRPSWIGGPAAGRPGLPPAPFVTPSQASLKALVTTGAGDMAMLGGILILYAYAGTLNFLELYAGAPAWLAAMAADPGMVVLVSLLLLAGPLGKSAQFPFQEWLPEAMAGPGPVSALIHAATMVKSGVYLIARLVPLFYHGYWIAGIDDAGWFFQAAAWAGAFTALLAASQGMVALELKKVLAYSTVSQIGYMLLGLGAAGLAPGLLIDGYTAGLFHLVSHALFKACLFLCAATVIHGVHSIYIDEMGGARRHLPLTWRFMLLASLSLMGAPPLPGFWSKDAVLLVAWTASPVLFGLGLVTAGLTAFYTVRMVALVFHGPESPQLAAVVRTSVAAHPPDDGARTMRGAAAALAVLIAAAGIGAGAIEGVLHHGVEASVPAQAGAAGLPAAAGAPHLLVALLSVLAIAAGAIPAWRWYAGPGRSADRADGGLAAALRRAAWRRWGIDAAYGRVFVDGAARLAGIVADRIEAGWDDVVHRRLPRLVLERAPRRLRRLGADTETLADNVACVVAAFAAALAVILLWAGGR